MDGWIKIHRSILNWEWWDDKNTFRLFFYCLIMANPNDTRWHGVTIPRGSFVSSYTRLATGTKLTVSEVRTALEHLFVTGELTRDLAGSKTIITINNYERYQGIVNALSQTVTQEDSNDFTRQSHGNRTAIADLEEKEKKIPPIPPIKENKKNDEEGQEVKNNHPLTACAYARGGEAIPLPPPPTPSPALVADIEKMKENFRQELCGQTMANESARRMYGLTNEQLSHALDIFTDKLVVDDDTRRSYGDFRRYFNTWLKRNKDLLFNNKTNNGTTNPTEGPRHIADASQFTDRP